jgi:hypothetical protein
MNEYYLAHIGKDKYMNDSYAHWLMSSNKWIYILGIFWEDKLHVSKESDSLTKNKKGIIIRAIKPYEGLGDVDHTIKELMSL